MEQRILQYRKSIDEWLEKTEQSAQVSQEILRDKMEEHLNQIGFFTLTSGCDSDFACSVYSSLLYFGK